MSKNENKFLKLYNQKKAETEGALFEDLSKLDGLMYDDMAKKLYKLGWRNKEVEEKYSFCYSKAFSVFLWVAVVAAVVVVIKEILPFFGVLI